MLRILLCTLLLSVSMLYADEAGDWQERVKKGSAALPDILKELDTANPTRANWLRTSADAIVERELQAGNKLDLPMLIKFLEDKSHNPRSRKMVFEWMVRAKPEMRKSWIATFNNDPSMELRREAVADMLEQIKAKKEKATITDYQGVISYTRDRDQVDEIAKAMKALGQELDIAEHFGFIRQWTVLSQFDNTGEKGFATVYDPEKKLDWKKSYTGKDNKPAVWKAITSKDPYGKMNLATDIAKHKSAVAYAVAIVKPHQPDPRLEQEIPVELRANTLNALKVWLNGKELIAHEEYHHGDDMDQYVGKGVLKPGENIIMVKVCQNDQKEPWAQAWEFALRACDAIGTPVRLQVLPVPVETAK